MYRRVLRAGSFGVFAVVGGFIHSAGASPLGTAFTYQGRLTDGGSPANGVYDLQFSLWDALSGGAQIGSTICSDNINVSNGLFTVTLDFGEQFNGDARWLQIGTRAGGAAGNCASGAYTVLSPRQPLTASPYALGLRLPFDGGASVQSDAALHVTNTFPGPLFTAYGIWGESAHPSGRGVYGFASGTSSANNGVVGETASNLGTGVLGWATATTTGFNPSTGVLGRCDGPFGRGVYGNATATTGTSRGVYGKTNSPNGYAGYFEGGRNYFEGNVGIGTDEPLSPLHLLAPQAVTRMVSSSATNGSVLVLQNDTASPSFLGAINFQPSAGTPGQIAYTGTDNMTFRVNGAERMRISSLGNVAIGTTSAPPGIRLNVNGTTRTTVLEITGADVAERFPTSEEVQPGMVVAIDPDCPGELQGSPSPTNRAWGTLRLARGAYNRCVAGIVSGANDFSAGAVLGNLAGHEDAPPVALSGRVYCWCDAANGAIQPGDLLTTSDTPGHAMKVTDFARAQGAIVGKAMTALPAGEKGLVMVLVTLQ
ncbi:MAG TPA: hypothetical protein VGM03_06335 [Phycisphaerae bacterium]